MQTIKHFAKVVGLGVVARLDIAKKKTTARSVRGIMRRFCNQWERVYHTDMISEIKLSIEPLGTITYRPGGNAH